MDVDNAFVMSAYGRAMLTSGPRRAALFIAVTSIMTVAGAMLETDQPITSEDAVLLVSPTVAAGVVAGAMRQPQRSAVLLLGLTAAVIELIGLVAGSDSRPELLVGLVVLKVGLMVALFRPRPTGTSYEHG